MLVLVSVLAQNVCITKSKSCHKHNGVYLTVLQQVSNAVLTNIILFCTYMIKKRGTCLI